MKLQVKEDLMLLVLFSGAANRNPHQIERLETCLHSLTHRLKRFCVCLNKQNQKN